MENTETRDRLIRQWLQAKQSLTQAQTAELTARNNLVAFYVGDHTDKSGTENFDLGNGYGLKFEFAQNHTVPSAHGGAAVKSVMERLRQMGREGELIAARVFRWKPELAKSEYDQLSPTAKRIVNAVVTTKPAQPAITFVEPGGAR